MRNAFVINWKKKMSLCSSHDIPFVFSFQLIYQVAAKRFFYLNVTRYYSLYMFYITLILISMYV
jgi:hypothetical protein